MSRLAVAVSAMVIVRCPCRPCMVCTAVVGVRCALCLFAGVPRLDAPSSSSTSATAQVQIIKPSCDCIMQPAVLPTAHHAHAVGRAPCQPRCTPPVPSRWRRSGNCKERQAAPRCEECSAYRSWREGHDVIHRHVQIWTRTTWHTGRAGSGGRAAAPGPLWAPMRASSRRAPASTGATSKVGARCVQPAAPDAR